MDTTRRWAALLGASFKPGEREEIRRLYRAGLSPSLVARMFRTTGDRVWKVGTQRNAHLPAVGPRTKNFGVKPYHLLPSDIDETVNRIEV